MALEKVMVIPGDHFAVTDEGKVIYTTVQEGYKEGIQWLHKLASRRSDGSGSLHTGMVYLCCKR